MARIISGKELSLSIKEKMKEEIIYYKRVYERLPHLVVVLVGDDPASKSYVKGKEQASLEIGIENTTICLPDDITEESLLVKIDELNNDDNVDGILVQLPLPLHINKEHVIERIRLDKDVDGFHPLNVAALWQKRAGMIPCTPRGIISLLNSANIPLAGKNAVVMGRSDIVGLPISKLLLDQNATVTIVHSRTENVKEITRKADILIVAIGKPKYVTADFIKDGAVVIDVGVNRDPQTHKLCGDCDFSSCEPKASFITKVPGGVGPMTICCLMQNTLEAYLHHMEEK